MEDGSNQNGAASYSLLLLQTFLRDPGSYPDHARKVEVRETHISEVYLTDQWAFKVKKPLRLAFLNYESLDARHEACLAEIQLNRRFSKDIYVGVAKITQEEDGRLKFDGKGPVVEYAVKMRRVPDSCLMDQRLARKNFLPQDQERLVAHLSECFSQAPKIKMDPSEYCRRLCELASENRGSLEELTVHLKLDPEPWKAISSSQCLFLHLHELLLEERVRLERVIDGHGDLRPEHIVFEENISMIDGIEFNRDMRIIDIADELSFLSMECALIGYDDLGQQLRQCVLNRMQDSVPYELLAFYESYRALVRAKVNLLKAEQLAGEKEGEVLKLAEDYRAFAEQRLKPVIPSFTFIICGAMGSGKTTLARTLKRDLGAGHLETDQIRRQLFGPSREAFAYGQGLYTFESRGMVYEKLQQGMLDLLNKGMNVIVDGSFGDPHYANPILDALRQGSRPYLLVVCECSDAEALVRIKQRMLNETSASEARPDLYLEQKERGDWTFKGHPQCRVDSQMSIENKMHDIYQAARRSLQAVIERQTSAASPTS